MPRRGDRKTWKGGFVAEGGVYWIDQRINGVRYRFSTRRTTKEGAIAVLTEFECGPEAYVSGNRQKVDFGEAVEKYLSFSGARNCSRHVRAQGDGFDRWARYLGGRGVGTLQQVTESLGAGFVTWRRAGNAAIDPEAGILEPRPVGESVTNRDLASLKALFRWARKVERIIPEDFDPLREVHLLKEYADVRPHRVVLHQDVLDARDMLEPKWAACVTVLYGTAFRYDSFARMSAAELEPAEKVIRDPYPKGKRAVEFGATDEVFAAAQSCVEIDGAGKRKWSYPEDNAHQLLRRLAVACRAAEVERFTPHDLRVTAATLMHRKGMPLRDLQHLLGHASLETTEKYVRADNASLRSARLAPI